MSQSRHSYPRPVIGYLPGVTHCLLVILVWYIPCQLIQSVGVVRLPIEIEKPSEIEKNIYILRLLEDSLDLLKHSHV